MNFEEVYGPPKERGNSTGLLKLLIVNIIIIVIFVGGLAFLLLFPNLDASQKLWWAGFISFLAALIIFAFFGSKSGYMKYFSAILFGTGVTFFYIAVWLAQVPPENEDKKLIGLIVITIIIVIILLLLVYLKFKKSTEKRIVKVMVRKKP